MSYILLWLCKPEFYLFKSHSNPFLEPTSSEWAKGYVFLLNETTGAIEKGSGIHRTCPSPQTRKIRLSMSRNIWQRLTVNVILKKKKREENEHILLKSPYIRIMVKKWVLQFFTFSCSLLSFAASSCMLTILFFTEADIL